MTARTTFKTIAITLAALGTAVAPAAFATPADTVSVEIDTRYLETDWGVEKIYDTLASKAEASCVTSSARDFSVRKFERDCMTDLLDDFIENAGHEKLTTYHASVTN
ncbi:MAG: UrcA family protein [Litorimonas sp.]